MLIGYVLTLTYQARASLGQRLLEWRGRGSFGDMGLSERNEVHVPLHLDPSPSLASIYIHLRFPGSQARHPRHASGIRSPL